MTSQSIASDLLAVTGTPALRAIALFQSKQWHAALADFDAALDEDPNNAELHNYRARVCESLERHEDALESLNRALKINPRNGADLRNRAVVLTKLERQSEALRDYESALSINPNDVDVLVRRAMLLNQVDRREEALMGVTQAVALRPNDPDVINARVIVLDNLGRYTDALFDIDRMLSLSATHLDAINNSGMILARIGRFKDALTCYDRSLAIKPEQPQAIYNRSLVRLALGDWIRGFKEFESRWNTSPLNKARLSGLGPLWLGGDEELNRKTILLYHEQGYGDTLQFVRYAPLLAGRGAKVILAVPPALGSLVRTVPGVSQVFTGNAALPSHDYQTPLMSLPLAFRTTHDTVPAQVPYLFAAPVQIKAWEARLGLQTKPRIGLAWSGRRYAPINYPRDVPLSALRPILALEAQFISLQKDMVDSDRETLSRTPNLVHVAESLSDFADTAALIQNLDLVITVDTAIAHLAGALGKPVWLMNRHASCWRWLQERSDSPWYPNLRQFRQPSVGDWTPVITAIKKALAQYIEGFRRVAETPARTFSAPSTQIPHSSGRSRSATKEKIRFVSATRFSTEEFFASAPLGRSLPVYRHFPKEQVIELRLFPDNKEGLSSIYNTAIEEAQNDPAILIFIHDDVYLSDYYWSEHLHEALEHFDLVGLAGNRRRVPRQASWMYLDEEFTRDNYDNLSGVLGHGEPFPNLKQLSVYGEPGQEVKLLDGVMMSIRSETLIEKGLRFDPRFKFHFYDLDFCRQAELRNIRMGTWAISVVHASAGALGVDSWRAAYRDYLEKYVD